MKLASFKEKYFFIPLKHETCNKQCGMNYPYSLTLVLVGAFIYIR